MDEEGRSGGLAVFEFHNSLGLKAGFSSVQFTTLAADGGSVQFSSLRSPEVVVQFSSVHYDHRRWWFSSVQFSWAFEVNGGRCFILCWLLPVVFR